MGINPNLKAGTIVSGIAEANAESVDREVEIIRDAAGDHFDELELHVMAFGVIVTDDRAGGLEVFSGIVGLTPEDIEASPYTLTGSPQEIADDLRSYRERRGISYFTVMADYMEAFPPVVTELAGT